MTSVANIGALAAFVLAGTTTAHASLIDLTNTATFTTMSAALATGTVDGVGFAITGSDDITYNTTTGPGGVGGLAGLTDGLGIGADDEIGGSEYITIVFNKKVRLTSALFLDMFVAPDGDDETATVYTGTPPAAPGFVDSVDATEIFVPGGAGFRSLGLSVSGQVFSFDAGAGNDGQGIGDFALAGLEFAVVPLPAAGLLLGTALWGFGLIGRRNG